MFLNFPRIVVYVFVTSFLGTFFTIGVLGYQGSYGFALYGDTHGVFLQAATYGVATYGGSFGYNYAIYIGPMATYHIATCSVQLYSLGFGVLP